jgi:hypothetical protein
LGAGSEMDGRAATVTQFEVTGNEIGVEMAEKDMANLQSEFCGVDKVLLDVALRVDNDGGRTSFVPEQIGCVGQATQIILFQNHGIFLELGNPLPGWPDFDSGAHILTGKH